MKKILIGFFAIFALTLVANAKTYTIDGVYTGSQCGDLCYMQFKTKKGKLTLYGYVEDYKNVRKGGKYKISYQKNMKIQVADIGKIKVDGIVGIKRLNQHKKSKKIPGKYLSYIKKECKTFGPPYCYIAKKYPVFQKNCMKGNRKDCKNIKELDSAISEKDLQSIHYYSNNW